jgi:serine protease AprX
MLVALNDRQGVKMVRFSLVVKEVARFAAVGGSLALLAGISMAKTAGTDVNVAKALQVTRSGKYSVIAKTTRPLTRNDKRAIAKLGGHVYRDLSLIDSVAIELPANKLSRLANLPFVAHLSEDLGVEKHDAFTVNDSLASTAWTQYGVSGSGVGVAVLDSGVRTSAEFTDTTNNRNRLSAKVNFAAGATTADQCGHGTHVAGIVGGNGANSSGTGFFYTFTGVAKRADVISVRVLDGQGAGTVSNVVAGINWVITNKSTYKIKVMNLSLGHPVGESYKTDPLCQAVEKAWKAGIVVVCSAGNTGRANATAAAGFDNGGYGTAYGSVQSPGNDPYVITVGAMKAGSTRVADQVATYSSRGPSRLDYIVKPDIVAPGNKVVSVLANNTYLERAFGSSNALPWSTYYNGSRPGTSANYFVMSGTSMAAPVVSGAVAMILEKYPSLTPDTVKARLMSSADKWSMSDGTSSVMALGAGYVNVPAAMRSTVVATSSALSPTVSPDSAGNLVVSMDRAMWGTGWTDLSSIYGSRALWGNGLGIGKAVLTDDRALWGNGLWGDNTVYSLSGAATDLSYTAIDGE